MMMDGKGCALILGLLALAGFVAGLVASWLGAPGWVPLAAAAGLPLAILALVALSAILGSRQ